MRINKDHIDEKKEEEIEQVKEQFAEQILLKEQFYDN